MVLSLFQHFRKLAKYSYNRKFVLFVGEDIEEDLISKSNKTNVKYIFVMLRKTLYVASVLYQARMR